MKFKPPKKVSPGKVAAVVLAKKPRTPAQAAGAKIGGMKRRVPKAVSPYGEPSKKPIVTPDQDLAPIGKKRRL